MFSFLSGKSYSIYDEMLNNLKDEAEKAKLKLNPKNSGLPLSFFERDLYKSL